MIVQTFERRLQKRSERKASDDYPRHLRHRRLHARERRGTIARIVESRFGVDRRVFGHVRQKHAPVSRVARDETVRLCHAGEHLQRMNEAVRQRATEGRGGSIGQSVEEFVAWHVGRDDVRGQKEIACIEHRLLGQIAQDVERLEVREGGARQRQRIALRQVLIVVTIEENVEPVGSDKGTRADLMEHRLDAIEFSPTEGQRRAWTFNGRRSVEILQALKICQRAHLDGTVIVPRVERRAKDQNEQ